MKKMARPATNPAMTRDAMTAIFVRCEDCRRAVNRGERGRERVKEKGVMGDGEGNRWRRRMMADG